MNYGIETTVSYMSIESHKVLANFEYSSASCPPLPQVGHEVVLQGLGGRHHYAVERVLHHPAETHTEHVVEVYVRPFTILPFGKAEIAGIVQ